MKTILITGSTDGIGKLTALLLAKNGDKIILHGRNQQKLNDTIVEVKEASNNENISGFIADLSDFKSIDQMLSNIKETHKSIDVLINNAGVFKSSITKNNTNLDLRFAVNYFAPYILTNGLQTVLSNSGKARVINLSSAAQAPVSIEALKGNQELSDQEAYAQSKLALTMWSFFFAKQYPTINTIAVNPGSLLNTKMVKEAYGQHWSSADKGANILFELATLDKFSEMSGYYFDNDRGAFNDAHPDAYNEEKVTALISETEKILNS